MKNTLAATIGLVIGVFSWNDLPARAAQLTWNISFWDEAGQAFGSGNVTVETEPGTLSTLAGPYTTRNIVTNFQFQVGPVTWPYAKGDGPFWYDRWIADDGRMGTITQSFFYPTAYPSLGSWRFISGLDRSRPVDKTLYLNGLFSPGQINDWTMSYLAVPFAQWGEWYSNPANQGQSIPTYNLRGTWRVEPLASTPEPGIAGAGLMALGLWGIRQRSRRSLQSTSRTIDS